MSTTSAPRRALLALLLVPLGTTSCTSDFTPPAQSPRLSVVMDGGQLVYVREGKRFPHGAWGGGLLDATAGVPAAEEAASTFRSRQLTGLGLTAGGAVAMLGGAGLAAGYHDNSSAAVSALSLGLLLGLGLMGAGAGVGISGLPYQWDAINLYNAEIDRRLGDRACQAPFVCVPAAPYAYPSTSPYPYPPPTHAPPPPQPPGQPGPPGTAPPPPPGALPTVQPPPAQPFPRGTTQPPPPSILPPPPQPL